MLRTSGLLHRLRPALRAAHRRPQLLGCGCALPLLVLIALIAVLVGRHCTASDADARPGQAAGAEGEREGDASPRLLLNRLWFDELPEKPTDSVDLWIFLAGGIGLHEKGSSYRAAIDLFEFERQGGRLEGRYLHDRKPLKTAFAVRSCDDHEPFDLCLTLDSLEGKKVELYGFGHDDDMDRHAPGSKAVLAAARARGEHVRVR